MRQTSVAVALAAVAAVLAGCGGDSPKAAYRQMWKAAERGDREACLSHFTRASQATMLELEQMAQELTGAQGKATKPIEGLMAEAKTAVLEIGEQKISGGRATLVVTINGKPRPTKLVREDGRWKIDNSEDLAKLKRIGETLKGLKGLKDAFDKRKKGR